MPPAKNPSDKDSKTSAESQQTSHHDETDVPAALKRDTQDGKGPDPVPETDFDSFATAGVEKDDLLSVRDVASEVLAGRWGANFATAETRLSNAGYNVDEVWAEVQRRKAGGAPSAF